jgi:hypothetical protein
MSLVIPSFFVAYSITRPIPNSTYLNPEDGDRNILQNGDICSPQKTTLFNKKLKFRALDLNQQMENYSASSMFCERAM